MHDQTALLNPSSCSLSSYRFQICLELSVIPGGSHLLQLPGGARDGVSGLSQGLLLAVRLCTDAGTHLLLIYVLICVFCALTSVYSPRPCSQEYSSF